MYLRASTGNRGLQPNTIYAAMREPERSTPENRESVIPSPGTTNPLRLAISKCKTARPGNPPAAAGTAVPRQ